MLKIFDFECKACKKIFEELVASAEAFPSICPSCGKSEGFIRCIGMPAVPKTIVVDYPGSQRLKAGYTHLHNRPAEKQGRQISMHSPKKGK